MPKPNTTGGSRLIQLREYAALPAHKQQQLPPVTPRPSQADVDAEYRAYLRQLGLLPAAPAADTTPAPEADPLQEAFRRCGMSDSAAAIAAKGRL